MFIKNLTHIFVVCLLHCPTYGQLFMKQGTLYPKNKPVERGIIKKLTGQSVVFKDTEKHTTALHLPANIDSLLSKDKKIISAQVSTGEGSISQLLIREEFISLFLSVYSIPRAQDRSNIIIRRRDGPFLIINEINYINELQKATYDLDDDGITRILQSQRQTYSVDFVTDVAWYYSAAMQPMSPAPSSRSQNSIIQWGITLGASSTSIQFLEKNQKENIGMMPPVWRAPVGIYMGLNPSATFSVDVELIFSQYKGTKRAEYSSSVINYVDIVKFTENALSLPIQLRVNIIPIAKSLLYVKGGPKFVAEIPAEGTITRQNGFQLDILTSTRRFGFGYNIATGVEKPLSNNRNLRIEYRYTSHGIQDGVTKTLNSISHQFVMGLALVR
jgi:opacity protein-like surface antigen